jgi:hypothetical protein
MIPAPVARLLRRSAHPAALLLVATSAACSLLELPSEPGSVLFQDDFSRQSSGWDRYRDETYSTDYAGGAYRIHVLRPNTDAWANPGLDLGDARLEVDATKAGGPDDNVFGVICRYQDARNFYFFLVSSDGYTGIGVYKDGRRRLLTDQSLLPHPAVAQGTATNHLRADCVGYRLDLYINGQWVAGAAAAEWPQGDVGLIAGTYELGGTELLFDNFSVLKAAPAP